MLKISNSKTDLEKTPPARNHKQRRLIMFQRSTEKKIVYPTKVSKKGSSRNEGNRRRKTLIAWNESKDKKTRRVATALPTSERHLLLSMENHKKRKPPRLVKQHKFFARLNLSWKRKIAQKSVSTICFPVQNIEFMPNEPPKLIIETKILKKASKASKAKKKYVKVKKISNLRRKVSPRVSKIEISYDKRKNFKSYLQQ